MYNLTKRGTAGRPAMYNKGVYKRRGLENRNKGIAHERRFTLSEGEEIKQSALGTMGFKLGGYFVTFLHAVRPDGAHIVTRVYVRADSKVLAIVKAEQFIDKTYLSVTAAPAGAVPHNTIEGVQHVEGRFKDYDASID